MKYGFGIRFKRIGMIAAAIMMCLLLFQKYSQEDVIVHIGGYAITKEHLELYENDCRAKVSDYFYQTYQQDPNVPGFWDMDFEGNIPSDMLAKKALARLKEDVVERIEARKHGIETQITLKEIQKSLDEENKRRARNEEMTYGPDQYGIMEYISKTQMEARDALMDRLSEQELKPSSLELRALYGRVRLSDLWKGKRAVVGAYMYHGLKVSQFPDELKDVWPYLKNEVQTGVSPETAVSRVKERYGVDIAYEEVGYDTASMPRDHPAMEWLVVQTKALEAGKWSEVVEYEASQGILHMIESEDYGMASYEEAQDFLETMWMREKYPEYLNEKKREYKIAEINETLMPEP